MIPSELLLKALQLKGVVPPNFAGIGGGAPATMMPPRRTPVQPAFPSQGAYGDLAMRMAGPMPTPRMAIPQPIPQGPGAMNLPTGLAPPMQLLQLLGGQHGF
jgi:hypothetical protein